MQTLAADKMAGGKSAYSTLSAAEMAKIRTGDLLMVTVDLQKLGGDSKIAHSMPAMARTCVNGLFMFPFATSLCAPEAEGGVYAPVGEVEVLPYSTLRRVTLPSLEETQGRQRIHLHYGADLEAAVKECMEKLEKGPSKAEKAFNQLLKKSGEIRRSYLLKVVHRISTTLSFAQWEAVAPDDPATPAATFNSMLKRDFLDTVKAEMLSSLNAGEDISQTKSAIGTDATNTKSVCLIMALLVGAEARAGPKSGPTTDVDGGGTGDASGGAKDGTDEAASVVGVKQEVEQIKTQLATVIKMLQLRDTIAGGPHPPKDKWEAMIMRVIHDHNCGFYASQVLGDASKKPGCEIVVSKAQAVKARATVLRLARSEWRTDPEGFKTFFQTDFDSYVKKHLEPPNTENWFGFGEAFLFAKEHPNLEIRIISRTAEGKTSKSTTLGHGEKQKKHVAFLMHTPGYHDIGMVQTGAKAAPKILFSHAEAELAEPLLISLAEQGSEANAGVQIDLTADDNATDEEFEKEMLSAMLGGKKASELPWEKVSQRGKQARQAKAQAKLAEQKKKDDALQAQALQQAQQSTMIALQKQVQKQQEQIDAQLQLASSQAGTAAGKSAAKAARKAAAKAAMPPPPAQTGAPSAAAASYAAVAGAAGAVPAPANAAISTAAGRGGGEFDHLLLGGSKVLPALVIFTKEDADTTWQAMKAVAPAAGALIVSAVKAGVGRVGERVVFHTKEASVAAVQSAVQTLIDNGVRAAAYKDQQHLSVLIQGRYSKGSQRSPSPPVPSAGLAGAAARGLSQSLLKSGVCRYYASQSTCHFGSQCRYKCYKDIGYVS